MTKEEVNLLAVLITEEVVTMPMLIEVIVTTVTPTATVVETVSTIQIVMTTDQNIPVLVMALLVSILEQIGTGQCS